MIDIDTLHIKTQGVIPPKQLQVLAMNGRWNTYRPRHHRSTNDYDRYEARIGSIVIKHTVQNQNLEIEIDSCGDFLFGNSMAPFLDEHVPAFMEKLERLLIEFTNVELFAPLADGDITRLDAKRDFGVGDELKDYLTVIGKHDVPNHTKNILGGGNTIQFENTSRTMKCYNRYANCLKKRKSTEETEMSKGVLRFEVMPKGSELRERLGMDKVTLGSVLISSITNELLSAYLDMFNLSKVNISTENDMYRALCAHSNRTKANNIISYLRAVEHGRGDDFSRTTRYEYEKCLAAAGLAPVIGTKNLPPLYQTRELRVPVMPPIPLNVDELNKKYKRPS